MTSSRSWSIPNRSGLTIEVMPLHSHDRLANYTSGLRAERMPVVCVFFIPAEHSSRSR
jgi:hypothetical protein